MADSIYDQSWRRRYNRFDKIAEPSTYCSLRDVKRGNSTHGIRRPYRPDYFETKYSQYEPMQEFRDNYLPIPENLNPRCEVPCENPSCRSERFRSIDSASDHHDPYLDRSGHRTYDRAYMNYCPAYSYQPVSPSKAFKEDVMKIVNPLLENMKSNSGNAYQQRNLDAYDLKPEPTSFSRESSNGNNEDLINRIKVVEKDINDINKALYIPNPEIIKRLDSLTQMYNTLKDSQSKPCDCKCKNVNFEELKQSKPSEDIKKMNEKVNLVVNSLKDQETQVQNLVKEIANLKNAQSSSPSSFEGGEIESKVKKIEKLQSDTSGIIDSLISKLEQTNKAVTEMEKKCDTKIKQIKIPEINTEDFVTNAEVNDVITQIDDKIEQIINHVDTKMKTQVKSIEESQNKSTQLLEKKIKDAVENTENKPKSAGNFEAIQKELSELSKYVAKLESEVESAPSKADVQTIVENLIKENKQLKSCETKLQSLSTELSKDKISNEIDEKLLEVANQLKKEIKANDKKGDEEQIKQLNSKLQTIENQIAEFPDYSDDIQNLNERLEILEGKTENDEDAGISADILFRFKNIEEHVESKIEETENSINELSNSLENTISKLEKEKAEVESKLESIEKQLKDKSVPPKQEKVGASEEDMKKISSDIDLKLDSFNNKYKNEIDKLVLKIEENKIENSTSLKEIKDLLSKVKEDSTKSFNSALEAIKKHETESNAVIKKTSEIVEQNKKECDKKIADLIDNNDKLKVELNKIDKKQNEETKETKTITQTPTFDETKLNKIEEEMKTNKEEINKNLADLKSDFEKEKGFQRDRILNCVQDSNASKEELKTLIKTSIDTVENSNKGKLKILEDQINDVKKSIKNYDPDMQKLTKDINELSKKTTDIENKANSNANKNVMDEIKTYVDTMIKNKLVDSIEKPLKIEEQKSKSVEAKISEPKQAEAKISEPKQAEAKASDIKPGESKPAELKQEEVNFFQAKPAEAKPAETKPVEAKPVESKPVEVKPSASMPVATQVKEEIKIEENAPKPAQSSVEEKKPESKTTTRKVLYDDFMDDFEDVDDDPDEMIDEEIKDYKEKALKAIKEMELFQIQSPFQDHRTPEKKIEEWIKRINESTQLKDIIVISQEVEDETGYDIGKDIFNNDNQQDDGIDLDNEFDMGFGSKNMFEKVDLSGEPQKQELYDKFEDSEEIEDDYEDDFAF